MSGTSPSTTISAISEAATGATDIGAISGNSIEGGIKAIVQTSATATVSAVSTAATADSINDGINAAVQSNASTPVVITTTTVDDALAAAATTTSSSSDSANNADSSNASVKDTSSSSTAVTSTTAKTSSSSSSSSGSDSTTTTSTSSTTSSSSQSTATSTSASSTSNSASISSALTSATQSNTITAGPPLATSLQPISTITSTNSIGQPVTLTSFVPSSSSASAQSEDLSNAPTKAFFQNKAAVGGVFGAVGLISLILLLAVVLKIVRYRANRKFERELNEQVDNEIRSGSPMFGFGKEDDGMSVRGMGMGAGTMDPEKSPYAGVGSYTSGNTAAYAAYGDRAPQAVLQPAYYSPNASGGAPRRPSLGHSRAGSQGSNRSYGSLAGAPMNPFAPATFAAPPATFASPGYNYNNGPNYNYATASPAPPANYGEYRGPSPAPSTQSYQSYGARPGTPTALTPGGGRASPAPGVAVPRGIYDPRTQSPGPGIIGSGIGVRTDSPVNPLQYSRSSRGSREYVPSGLGRQPTQTLGVPAGNLSRGNSVNSIKAPLPNPFDQRDS